ncbi:unnamed protein product, partial [Polarella glacialis]
MGDASAIINNASVVIHTIVVSLKAENARLLSTLRAVQEACKCPITHALPEKPVVASDGFCYDEGAIEQWLQHSQTSPMTRSKLETGHLLPNRSVQRILEIVRESGVECSDGEENEGDLQIQGPINSARSQVLFQCPGAFSVASHLWNSIFGENANT